MNETALKPPGSRKGFLGIVAIVCFCFGTKFYLHAALLLQDNTPAWAAIMGATQGKAGGWWITSVGGATYTVLGGLVLCGLGLALAVAGLRRAEQPRWLAIAGLVLCLLPFLLVLVGWGLDVLRRGQLTNASPFIDLCLAEFHHRPPHTQ